MTRNSRLNGVSGPQLAFVRSWAEGLDVAVAWQRYLAPLEPADLRRAKAELQRLLDELRTMARSQGQPQLAALLRRDPSAIVDQGGKRPSLEAFRDQHPPDFYSESELVELYEAKYGRVDARSSVRRRQRLRERLLQALQWFESLVARSPQLADRTDAWLDERLCARLAAAGVLTLSALRDRVQQMGPGWHRGVPRLGVQGALRLARWWQGQVASLGPWPQGPLAETAAAPAPRFGLVPLERLLAPPALDGRMGINRAPASACRLAAHDDLQAVQAWLASHADRPHTWRSYRREAERWLLWAWLVRGCALSSLQASDCDAYLSFVRNPGKSWTVGRQVQRSQEAWRPFEAGLSERSVAVTRSILQALGAWLQRHRYWSVNPWTSPDASERPRASVLAVRPDAPSHRSVSPAQWRTLWDWAASRPASAAQQRQLCALALAYGAGLRLSEMAHARGAWLVQTADDQTVLSYALRIPGRAGMAGEVPLAHEWAQALLQSLAGRGVGLSDADAMAQAPLLASLRDGRPLSAARIYGLLRDLFAAAALALSDASPDLADKLSRASTHWLRHSRGLHSLAEGVPQAVVQARLGHASAFSTGRYGADILLGWR